VENPYSLGVDVNGVSLPEDFSRFATFTKADYDAIYAKLVADTDGIRANIKKDTDVNAASELPVTNVTVEVIG
jgi:basic membrane protein A and related proteins